MRIGIALRTDVFDRQTPRLLTVARPSLVTNMGAGLCTRYYGLGQPAIDWIEVDVPDVNCVTAQRAAGDEHHRMIARQVTDHAWIKQIPASLATPPLFIAEGLLMYLGSSEVKSLLFALKRRFPGSRLLADVISPVHFTLGVRRQEISAFDSTVERLGHSANWIQQRDYFGKRVVVARPNF